MTLGVVLTMGQSPDEVLNTSDPGDDTQHRFRYQAIRACCYILALFDDEEGIEEVFCEHHEDILVRYRTGKFLGVQIKTKADDLVPLKAGDEEVVKSLRRFIEAEKDFPGHFDGYLLGTNCGFWREAKNGSNLSHLIAEAVGKDAPTAPKCVTAYLNKLCPKQKALKPKPAPKSAGKQTKGPAQAASTATNSPVASTIPPPETHATQLARALAILQKIRLDQTPPLANLLQPLLDALARCPEVGVAHRYCDLETIAGVIVGEVLAASSREHTTAKRHYFAICQNPQQVVTDATIDAKRFSRTRAGEVLRRGLASCGGKQSPTPFSVDQLPEGTRNQQLKLTAGGVVIDQVDEAVQQRLGVEGLLAGWIHKHGVVQANARYQDVRSAVLTQCNEAREQAAKAGGQYGPEMLKLVKERIRTLHETEGGTLHGLRYDQLLGIAGILTEECPLWWSEQFDLAQEAGP